MSINQYFIFNPKALDSLDNLRLALTIPTTVVWYEETGKTIIDPITGNEKPEKTRHSAAAPYSAGVHNIKGDFGGCLCALAALAKRISSPTYLELRACYHAYVGWFQHHNMLGPMDEQLADEILEKFSAALLALALDIQIEMEV